MQFLNKEVQLVCVGAAQCTLCRGPWSSTGSVPWYGVDVPVVVQRQVPWPTLLAHAWLERLPGSFLDEFLTIST